MYAIKPLGDEEEILREARANTPETRSNEQTAPVESLQPPLAPLSPMSSSPSVPVTPLQKRRRWLLILAIATILANCYQVSSLLLTPSDTSMMFAGKTLFAMPIEGDPKALSHPVDYLTMGLALIQIILACLMVKFRWARIAIAYAAIATLCLAVRAFMLSVSMPEGETIWYAFNPLAVILVALFTGVNIVPELLASFIIPFVLIITTVVLSFRDWRESRHPSEQAQTLQSALSE